jgi:hypothetical protein
MLVSALIGKRPVAKDAFEPKETERFTINIEPESELIVVELLIKS